MLDEKDKTIETLRHDLLAQSKEHSSKASE